jgi:hypothetical protein
MKVDLLNKNRRSFLKGRLALSNLSFLNPVAILSQAEQEDSDFRILTGPYLQIDFLKGMFVLWITNRNCNSWVEYGE